MNAATHSASGDPASSSGVIVFRNKPLLILCRSVMSSANRRSVSWRLSVAGYGASSVLVGGTVLAGVGDVSANTRAAANASAYELNSLVGVT